LEQIKNLLAKPAPESRPWAQWIWNSCISEEKLVHQLSLFIEKGFGGICIKPSRDMSPSFLSEEFFDLFQKVLEIAQKGGIGIRLSEDFSLPWNGMFESPTNNDKRMRAQSMYLEHAEMIGGKKSFERPVADPDSAVIIIAKMAGNKVVLSQTKKITLAPDKDVCTVKPAPGDWQLMIFRKKYVSDPVGGYLPNVFNPAVAQWYLNSVGEVLKRKFSKYFHSTFKGFVYEMPTYTVPSENGIPWDDELAAMYQSRFKKRLIEQLPALFFPVETEQVKNRLAIYSCINQTMQEHCTTVIEKWCAKNRVSQWILYPERSMHKNGSAIKNSWYLPDLGTSGAVGIQNLDGSDENNHVLRTVSDSNTLQFRRETVTMIGRNRQGGAATLQQLKAEVDRGILIGPSTVCLDGCFFNIDRRSYVKTPHNPSWYAPSWEQMKSLCEYASRAAQLTRNCHCIRPAAVLDMSSFIAAEYCIGASDQAQKTASLFQATVRELERHGIDFDVVNQEALVSCSVFTTGEFAPANKIRKGNYRAIILPPARLISGAVLAFLEKIAQKSGTVIFVEEAPLGTLEDGTSAASASRIKKLFNGKKDNIRTVALKDIESLSIALGSKVSVTILGKKCPDSISSHGAVEGLETFAIHNTSESQEYFASVELPEQKNLYVVDCTKGEIFEIQEIQRKDNKSRINLTFLPKQTYFVVSSAQKLQTTVLPKGKKPLINTIGTLQRSYCIVLKDQWQFVPSSLNMLPLANWNTRIGLSREFGGYSLFYEAYFEVKDVPDNCVLALGGLVSPMNRLRCASMDKPLEVAINGARASEISAASNPSMGQPGEAAAVDPLHSTPIIRSLFGESTFVYNIKDHIRKGINRISLRTLGLVFDPLTIAYPPLIAGTFSIIKGSTGWILSAASPVVGHDSWTKYGYPYLSGAGVYKQVFELPGEYNRLVLRFSQVSDSIDVAVNEKQLGILNWHPLEFDITDVCDTRRNELTVRIVNTIDNVLRMNGRASGLLGEVYVDVY